MGTLIRIGFGAIKLENSEFEKFCGALTEDERYLDRIEAKYGFEPTIRPESTARPSLIAIVNGTALCSEEERQDAATLMNCFAEVMYAQNSRTNGVLHLREVEASFRAAGLGDLSHQEFGAFLSFMRQDIRFYRLGDGRIVLTDVFRGDVEGVAELPRIDDIAAAIKQTLPRLSHVPYGVFTEGMLLGAMKSQGLLVRRDQLQEVSEQLGLSARVSSLPDGRYKLVEDDPPAHDTRSKEQQLALDAMLKAIKGNGQPKPHSKNRGRGRKRIVDM